MDDAGGLRAVRKAVKSILDTAADERLRTLCKVLDSYRQKVAVGRRYQKLEVQNETQERQLQRISNKTQPLFTRRREKKTQLARRVQGDITGEDEAEEPQLYQQGGRPAQDERAVIRRTREKHSTSQRQGRQNREPPSTKPLVLHHG